MNAVRPIYEYSNPRQFVLDRFAQRAESEREFSVRRAAREAGLKSHVPLLWILQGKRGLHPRHVEWLSSLLSLSAEEATYLRLLILKQRSKTELDRSVYENALKGCLASGAETVDLHEIDEAEIVRNPIHASILAATQTKDGITSIADLHEHFSWTYGKWDLQAAVERLLRNGLLEDSGGKLRCVHARTSTRNDRIWKAILEYHQNVMALAERRLFQDPPEEREFQALALAMSRAKTPQAKEMIRAFVREFERAMEADAGEEVYQISIQFVRLSALPPALQAGRECRDRSVPSAVQADALDLQEK